VRGEDTENRIALPHIALLNGRFGVRVAIHDIAHLSLSTTVFDKQNHVAATEKNTPGNAIFYTNTTSSSLHVGPVQYSLTVGVRNLLNTSYRNHLSTNRGWIISESGRNVYFKMNVHW